MAASLDPLQVLALGGGGLERHPYPLGIPKGTFLQVEPPPPLALLPLLGGSGRAQWLACPSQ